MATPETILNRLMDNHHAYCCDCGEYKAYLVAMPMHKLQAQYVLELGTGIEEGQVHTLLSEDAERIAALFEAVWEEENA